MDEFILNKKRIGRLIIYGTIIFCWYFFNNFLTLLLCKMYVFDVLNMVDYLTIFLIPRSNEYLILSNFRLGV